MAVISAQGWTITNGYNIARAVESLECLRRYSRRRQALTATNHPGKPEVGHNELSAMATGAMLCWLTHDTYAVMRITEEIENLGSPGAGRDDFRGNGREDAGGGGGHESERDHRRGPHVPPGQRP